MSTPLRLLRHTLFAALVAAVVALAILNVQAWRGALVDDRPPQASAPAAASTAGGTAQDTTSADATPAAPVGGIVAAPTTSAARAPAGASMQIVVRAARGPCWLLARAGSARGEILFEGTLAQGRSLTLSRDRVWLRLGAPANVQISVNGEAVQGVSSGTTDLIATAAGVKPASA